VCVCMCVCVCVCDESERPRVVEGMKPELLHFSQGQIAQSCNQIHTPSSPHPQVTERVFLIDNLLVRIHLIIDMILVDRPCAVGFFKSSLIPTFRR